MQVEVVKQQDDPCFYGTINVRIQEDCRALLEKRPLYFRGAETRMAPLLTPN